MTVHQSCSVKEKTRCFWKGIMALKELTTKGSENLGHEQENVYL